MDLIRARALVKVIVGACDELTLALRGDAPVRPADRPAPAVTGWPTGTRIAFLRQWYPTYALSALIFRAIRAMDGPQPGSDGGIVTYAVTRLGLKRPADIRSNPVKVSQASREICEAVGFDNPVPVVVRGPAVATDAAPRAAAALAGPGAALWHPWATIKELARRDGVILDGMDDLPRYNKRRQDRGLAPLYLKTFKTGQS